MGVPVNSAALNGTTSLSFASYLGHVDVVELLLLHGASIDMPDEQGFTAVHWAVIGGNLECFQLIMGYSLDDQEVLRRRVKAGDTLLHLACMNQNKDMVDAVLSKCPELKDFRNSNGQLPVDVSEGDKYLHCLLSTLQRFPVSCLSLSN